MSNNEDYQNEIPKYIYSDYSKTKVNIEKFIIACKNGNLIEAEKFYNDTFLILSPSETNIVNNFGYIIACAENKENIINWLNNYLIPYCYFDLNTIIRSFIYTCKNKNFNTSILLYTTLSLIINKNNYDDYLFFNSYCYSDIGNLLYSSDKKHIKYGYFLFLCYYGNLEFIKWIYLFNKKYNIRKYNDFIFKIACYNKNIKALKILTELCSDYFVEYDDYDNIKSWKIKNELDHLYERKEYDKLIEKMNIIKVYFADNQKYKDNKCIICLSDNYNFF